MRRIKTENRMRYWKLAAGIALTAALFSGCTSERREQELSYRQLGIEYMQQGSYTEAIVVFNQALSECSGKVGAVEIDICYYKAAAQYASGDVEGALETYDALVGYDAKNADARYMRGCLRLQTGDSNGAAEDFDAAVKQDAKNYELYVNIYENLAANGMAEEGASYLDRAFSIGGDEVEDLTWRGRIYFLLGQNDNAIQELKAALEKGSVDANLIMGEVCEAMGDEAAAGEYYQVFAESGEADPEVMNRLAGLAMRKQDYAGALTYVLQGLAMEQVPNRQELMRDQIVCLEYTGDFAGAWAVEQEYVALYPEDLEAQREYVFLKSRQVTDDVPVDIPAEVSSEESSEESGTEE